MQYVGYKLVLPLKTFLREYHRMKKPEQFDSCLYQHFICTGHSPNDILVQPVEKITYQENPSAKFRIKKSHVEWN